MWGREAGGLQSERTGESEVLGATKRARATGNTDYKVVVVEIIFLFLPPSLLPAAASAVDAALAASKPRSKPLTTKQRLGKILGLNKFGGRWKK